MILAFTGPLGGGKTLMAIMKASYYSLRAGGVPIWSNTPLNARNFAAHAGMNPAFKVGFLGTPEDIVRMVAEGGGIMLLDEIHQSIDSRLSTSAAQAFVTQWLAFLRKQGITCFYTTQHEAQIDKRMRFFTDLMHICLSFGPKGAKDFMVRIYHAVTKQPLKEERFRTVDVQSFFSAYDTYAITERMEFPSTQKAFDLWLKRIKEAQSFARNYHGDPHRAWAAFVSQSRDAASKALASGETVPPTSGLRKATGAGKGTRRKPGTVAGAELATEAG
jgi:hypothetical protein